MYKEVLRGLDRVPTPNCPGTIIVTGKSQAILTSKSYLYFQNTINGIFFSSKFRLIKANTGDVIIAAVQHSKGKIITFAHDCYLDWLFDNNNRSPQFNANVINWLTGQNSLKENEIIGIRDFKSGLTRIKLIKWNHLHVLDTKPEVYEADLLKYLENGGDK